MAASRSLLGDLFEIAGQHLDDLVDVGARVVVECCQCRCGGLLQHVQQFDREPGEVVDKVERVFDFVGDRRSARSLAGPGAA
jgi:hypothetical protein